MGIVHIGIGAFHRAHQAMYTDAAMDGGDANWAITGVSLRSPDVRQALAPQDGLYSLIERDGISERVKIIGSVRNVLVAPENPAAVIAALASPDVHVVTLTVTEKGYHRRPADGLLDVRAPDIAHDLSGGAPRTLFGFLERGLAARRAAGLPGLTLLSCDNLPENGRVLAALLSEFLEARDPSVAVWFGRECTCPSTMVDRIVPATTAADLQHLREALGLDDRGAVFTESFSQWVIEDRFAGPRPHWECAGAQLTADVRPYETAKLRMLNGAHSALAYVGLALGYDHVHEAIADRDVLALVQQLMTSEAAASFTRSTDQDLAAYAASLLTRFSNSALNHKLLQIAMDGTQKLPQRWLATVAALTRTGQAAPAVLFAFAAWISFICTRDRPLDDPLAAQLYAIRNASGADARAAVAALVGSNGLFSKTWQASEAQIESLAAQVHAIRTQGMRAALCSR